MAFEEELADALKGREGEKEDEAEREKRNGKRRCLSNGRNDARRSNEITPAGGVEGTEGTDDPIRVVAEDDQSRASKLVVQQEREWFQQDWQRSLSLARLRALELERKNPTPVSAQPNLPSPTQPSAAVAQEKDSSDATAPSRIKRSDIPSGLTVQEITAHLQTRAAAMAAAATLTDVQEPPLSRKEEKRRKIEAGESQWHERRRKAKEAREAAAAVAAGMGGVGTDVPTKEQHQPETEERLEVVEESSDDPDESRVRSTQAEENQKEQTQKPKRPRGNKTLRTEIARTDMVERLDGSGLDLFSFKGLASFIKYVLKWDTNRAKGGRRDMWLIPYVCLVSIT